MLRVRIKQSALLVGVVVGALALTTTSLNVGIVVILAFGASLYFKLMKALRSAK